MFLTDFKSETVPIIIQETTPVISLDVEAEATLPVESIRVTRPAAGCPLLWRAPPLPEPVESPEAPASPEAPLQEVRPVAARRERRVSPVAQNILRQIDRSAPRGGQGTGGQSRLRQIQPQNEVATRQKPASAPQSDRLGASEQALSQPATTSTARNSPSKDTNQRPTTATSSSTTPASRSRLSTPREAPRQEPPRASTNISTTNTTTHATTASSASQGRSPAPFAAPPPPPPPQRRPAAQTVPAPGPACPSGPAAEPLPGLGLGAQSVFEQCQMPPFNPMPTARAPLRLDAGTYDEFEAPIARLHAALAAADAAAAARQNRVMAMWRDVGILFPGVKTETRVPKPSRQAAESSPTASSKRSISRPTNPPRFRR